MRVHCFSLSWNFLFLFSLNPYKVQICHQWIVYTRSCHTFLSTGQKENSITKHYTHFWRAVCGSRVAIRPCLVYPLQYLFIQRCDILDQRFLNFSPIHSLWIRQFQYMVTETFSKVYFIERWFSFYSKFISILDFMWR